MGVTQQYILLYGAVLHILNIAQYMIVCIWSVWPSIVKGRSDRHKEEGVEVKNELMSILITLLLWESSNNTRKGSGLHACQGCT